MVKRRNLFGKKEGGSAPTPNNEQWLPVDPENDSDPEFLTELQPRDIALDVEPFPSADEKPIVFVDAPTARQRLQFRFGLLVSPLWDGFRRAVSTEIEEGAAFVWSPVFFGLGCILYFNLPREPLVWAFPTLAILCFLVALKIGRGHWAGGAFIAVFLVAAGSSAGQLRTQILDTVMLPYSVVAQVRGRVIQAEHRSTGSIRYTIDITKNPFDPLSGMSARGIREYPDRIRVTARKGGPVVAVGQWIEGQARIGPPSGPSFPGAYDFSFQSWFKGIGASGFFYGKPKLVQLTVSPESSWSLTIAQTRGRILSIIRDALPGRGGALASALIVGDRSGIDKDTAEALRRSGLAHILAISGLHMGLVALTLIYMLRALFACFPAISLKYPVKKWAACLALGGATVYLFISGTNVSTQRAYIMVAIMLLAMVFDRRALTMRNVAIAAFIVLFISPEAVMMPGFQMSFAAVAALVAAYESISRRRRNKNKRMRSGVFGVIYRFVVRDMGGLATTSLVAGLATGLFAAYHFYRIAPFGLLANLLAMPLVSFLVMPLALISVLAMPFGLEGFSLGLMARATEIVVAIAGWVAGLEPQGNVGFMPILALAAGSSALLLVTLFRTRLKLLALPFVVLAAVAVGNKKYPDILVLENGKQVGILNGSKGLSLLRPRADKFSTKMWKNAFDPDGDGLRVSKSDKGSAEENGVFRCDNVGCSAQVKGFTIVQLQSTSKLNEDCKLADVLVIPYYVPRACAALPQDLRPIILDRGALSKFGARSFQVLALTNANQDKAVRRKKGFGLFLSQSYGQYPRPWNRQRFR